MAEVTFIPSANHFGPITVSNREVMMDGKLVLAQNLTPGKEYIIDTITAELREKSDDHAS